MVFFTNPKIFPPKLCKEILYSELFSTCILGTLWLWTDSILHQICALNLVQCFVTVLKIEFIVLRLKNNGMFRDEMLKKLNLIFTRGIVSSLGSWPPAGTADCWSQSIPIGERNCTRSRRSSTPPSRHRSRTHPSYTHP